MDTPRELAGALTAHQPWATAIIDGRKDVENRSWAFPLPAPAALAIHASVALAMDSAIRTYWPDPPTRPNLGALRALPRGAFLGVVIVPGSHPAADCQPGGCSPWAAASGHHWTLRDPRRLPEPLPAVGQLRIWQPSPIHRAVLETVCLKGHH